MKVPKNAPDIMNQIGDVGLEYEFSNCMRDTEKFNNMVNNTLPGWSIVHDASSETPRLSIGEYPIKFSNENELQEYVKITKDTKIKVFGGELTSPILTPDAIYQNIYKLVDLLIDANEIIHERGSFHVHVNVGGSAITLSALKKVLRIINSIEAILYRLGGLGRINRGESNHFIYQRPYLGHGPIVYKHGNRYIPILRPEDLLASESKKEFFDRCGDLIKLFNNGDKYVTPRYMGTNFFSILRYGSIEFRYANTSLNPAYLNSWVELCRAIIFTAFDSRDHDLFHNELPLYKNEEVSDNHFSQLIQMLGLNESSCIGLFDAWRNSPTPKFNNIWTTSHLKNPTIFDPREDTKFYLPKEISGEDKVQTPSIVDVHTLDNSFRDLVARAGNVAFKVPQFKLNLAVGMEHGMPDEEEEFDVDNDNDDEDGDFANGDHLENEDEELILDSFSREELMHDSPQYRRNKLMEIDADFLEMNHNPIKMMDVLGYMFESVGKDFDERRVPLKMFSRRTLDNIVFYFETDTILKMNSAVYRNDSLISPRLLFRMSSTIY